LMLAHLNRSHSLHNIFCLVMNLTTPRPHLDNHFASFLHLQIKI